MLTATCCQSRNSRGHGIKSSRSAKAKNAVHSIIIALLALQLPQATHADAGTCSELFSPSLTPPAAEQLVTAEPIGAEELLENQLQRARSEGDIKKIDKLKKKLLSLRKVNGIWETTQITEKRMTALGFEMFTLINDLKSIETIYAPDVEFTEKAAVRYLASEAMLKYYQDRLARGTLDQAQANQLIQTETKNLALTRAEFLDYADKTMSIAFVLEVMKTSGSLVDVSTMFGSASRTTDIHGNEIVGVKVIPGRSTKPAVPIQVPMTSTQVPAPPLQIQAETLSLATIDGSKLIPIPVVAPGASNPVPAPANPPVAPKTPIPPLPAVEISPDEIKLRGSKINETFGKYLQTEAIVNVIEQTRQAVGSDFLRQRLSYSDLSALRRRLQPDWNSTSVIVKRLKDEIRAERWLRAKLITLGPQASEIITTWIGTAKPGSKVENLAPLARLAGMVYDDSVRLRNMSTILKVLSLPDSESKFNALMTGNGNNPYAAKGELITAFIRFTLGRNDWNQIKTFIANSPYSYDKLLNAQFDAYEKEAVQRGPLGPINVSADPIGAVLMSGLLVGNAALASGGSAVVANKFGAFSALDSAWVAAQTALSPTNIEALLHMSRAAGVH